MYVGRQVPQAGYQQQPGQFVGQDAMYNNFVDQQ